jgi:hypothetical protein
MPKDISIRCVLCGERIFEKEMIARVRMRGCTVPDYAFRLEGDWFAACVEGGCISPFYLVGFWVRDRFSSERGIVLPVRSQCDQWVGANAHLPFAGVVL